MPTGQRINLPPILGSQVSAIGSQVQVIRYRYGFGSRTWRPNLRPEILPLSLVFKVGLSALAQPRLTEGGQPYPLHPLSTGQLVNESTNVVSFWPTDQRVN